LRLLLLLLSLLLLLLLPLFLLLLDDRRGRRRQVRRVLAGGERGQGQCRRNGSRDKGNRVLHGLAHYSRIATR
jgi:hypothetical protein